MIEIRAGTIGDTPAMQQLLAQLGYSMTVGDLLARLEQLLAAGPNPVLVAVDGTAVIGLLALHWASMLQHPAPIARITTLVVRDDMRGRGVGRLLIEAAAELAKGAGCGVLKLTTAMHRTEAHAF